MISEAKIEIGSRMTKGNFCFIYGIGIFYNKNSVTTLLLGRKLTGSTKNNNDGDANNNAVMLIKKQKNLRSNILWSAWPVKEKK